MPKTYRAGNSQKTNMTRAAKQMPSKTPTCYCSPGIMKIVGLPSPLEKEARFAASWHHSGGTADLNYGRNR
jgi:hypothetical protein